MSSNCPVFKCSSMEWNLIGSYGYLPSRAYFPLNVMDNRAANNGTGVSGVLLLLANFPQTYNLSSNGYKLRKMTPYAMSSLGPGDSDENGFSDSDRRTVPKVGTRLSKIAMNIWAKIRKKLGKARERVPLKIFSLLLGYYSANALSTLVGQTGDWDVLVAGVAVALMEGISFLTYRLPSYLNKFEDFFGMLNLWKLGLSIGFLLDKFKLDCGQIVFWDNFWENPLSF